MIKFLPTTLNQLFRVLTSATQEDVAVNVTRQVPRVSNRFQLIDTLKASLTVFHRFPLES